MNNSHEFEIEVYNADGEPQLIDFSGNAPDVSNLPEGQYTICFRQGDDMYTDRVLK